MQVNPPLHVRFAMGPVPQQSSPLAPHDSQDVVPPMPPVARQTNVADEQVPAPPKPPAQHAWPKPPHGSQAVPPSTEVQANPVLQVPPPAPPRQQARPSVPHNSQEPPPPPVHSDPATVQVRPAQQGSPAVPQEPASDAQPPAVQTPPTAVPQEVPSAMHMVVAAAPAPTGTQQAPLLLQVRAAQQTSPS